MSQSHHHGQHPPQPPPPPPPPPHAHEFEKRYCIEPKTKLAAIATAAPLPYLAGFVVLAHGSLRGLNSLSGDLGTAPVVAVPSHPIVKIAEAQAEGSSSTEKITCVLKQLAWLSDGGTESKAPPRCAYLVALYTIETEVQAAGTKETSPTEHASHSDPASDIEHTAQTEADTNHREPPMLSSAIRYFKIELGVKPVLRDSGVVFSSSILSALGTGTPEPSAGVRTFAAFGESQVEIYTWDLESNSLRVRRALIIGEQLACAGSGRKANVETNLWYSCKLSNINDVHLTRLPSVPNTIVVCVLQTTAVVAFVVTIRTGGDIPVSKVVSVKNALLGPLSSILSNEDNHIDLDSELMPMPTKLCMLESRSETDQVRGTSITWMQLLRYGSGSAYVFTQPTSKDKLRGTKQGPEAFEVLPHQSLFSAVASYARTLEYTGNRGANGEFIFQKLPWQVPKTEMASDAPAVTVQAPEETSSAAVDVETDDLEPITTLRLPEPDLVPGWRPTIIEVVDGTEKPVSLEDIPQFSQTVEQAPQSDTTAPKGKSGQYITLTSTTSQASTPQEDGIISLTAPQSSPEFNINPTSPAEILTIRVVVSGESSHDHTTNEQEKTPIITQIATENTNLGLVRALRLFHEDSLTIAEFKSLSKSVSSTTPPQGSSIEILSASQLSYGRIGFIITTKIRTHVMMGALVVARHESSTWPSALDHSVSYKLSQTPPLHASLADVDPPQFLAVQFNNRNLFELVEFDAVPLEDRKPMTQKEKKAKLRAKPTSLSELLGSDLVERFESTGASTATTTWGGSGARDSTSLEMIHRRLETVEERVKYIPERCKCACIGSNHLMRIENLLQRLEERVFEVEKREADVTAKLKLLEERERRLLERESRLSPK